MAKAQDKAHGKHDKAHGKGKPAPKRMSKSQLFADLATHAEIDRKSVARVFEGLQEILQHELGSKGPGEFVIPGLLKLRTVVKPAVPEHEGINPFNKQKQIFKAKPESRRIRATPLKAIKDVINSK